MRLLVIVLVVVAAVLVSGCTSGPAPDKTVRPSPTADVAAGVPAEIIQLDSDVSGAELDAIEQELAEIV